MGFDSKAFMVAKFELRTEAVKVPELADWFGGEAPVWTIRGLTGKEYGRVNEAVARNKNVEAFIKELTSESPKKLANGLGKVLIGVDVADDIAKRISLLGYGSVDPVCELEMTKRLCKFFCEVFYNLTTKIILLSGQGSVVGGQKPSGKTKK